MRSLLSQGIKTRRNATAVYNGGLKKLLLVLSLVAAVGVTWLLVRRSAPPEITFVRVKRETLVSAIQTNGKVEPLRMMAARAERSGIVGKVHIEEGQRVSEAAVIAELITDAAASDLTTAKARVDEAQSEIAALKGGGRESELVSIENGLAEAKVRLENARREAATLKRLESKQAATAEEVKNVEREIELRQLEIQSLEKKRAALVSSRDIKAAEARLRQAQAEVSQAERSMAQAVVRAGMAGVVYKIVIRPGSFLEQGGLTAEIGQLEKVRVIIYVDEPDLGRVAIGMPVVVTWDARPGREWRGTVDRLAMAIIKLATRQVGEILAVVDNPRMELLPEANVNVEIRSRVAENALTIPKEALRRRDDKPGVYVLEGDNVQWRAVQSGASNITRVEILSVLKEGDAVAVATTDQLQNGMRVKPVFQ